MPLFCGPCLDCFGLISDLFRHCLCLAKATPIKATDSRLGAPLNRGTWQPTPVRRNGQASPFFVADSRRGAPGGCPLRGCPIVVVRRALRAGAPRLKEKIEAGLSNK